MKKTTKKKRNKQEMKWIYPKKVNENKNANIFNKDNIEKIINSKIEFYNTFMLYYINYPNINSFKSIFRTIFKNKINYRKSPTYVFNNFIEEIEDSSFNKIEIFNFTQEYNKINNKFNGYKGNNPKSFFKEFIKRLGDENNGNFI